MNTKRILMMSAMTSSMFAVMAASIPSITIPSTGRMVEVIADCDNTFKVTGQKKPIIYAQAGEPLHLKIVSRRGGESAHDGAVHSFVIRKLKDPSWEFRLKEGVFEYDVIAPLAAGEYLIECTVKCGRGHEDMNMKLVVSNGAPKEVARLHRSN